MKPTPLAVIDLPGKVLQVAMSDLSQYALLACLAVLSTVASAKVEALRRWTDGSLWLWGFGSAGGQGDLAKNLRVPTLLELP